MITRTHITIAAVILAVILLSVINWLNAVTLPDDFTDGYPFTIEKGMSAHKIAGLLASKNIINSPLYFIHVSQTKDYSSKFKAGKHLISNGLTVKQLALLLTQNPPSPPDIKVTVIEGLNIRETASVLAAAALIDSAEFVSLAMDKSIAGKLSIDNDTLEGYLYPDTYFVKVNTKPLEMIERMVALFHRVFNDSLINRAAGIGMSVNEAVTLASLIETEAQLDSERPTISGVFHRRLTLSRPLESNSSIQFALGEKRRVLTEDLEVESPYNTYTHRGLPPGPIVSPSVKSLLAALWPEETNYLYFVADGNGGHTFSRTLAEHNTAVRKYRILRRKQRAAEK